MPGDVDFLVELIAHPEVKPFLAATTPASPDDLVTEIEHSQAELAHHGRLIAKVLESGEPTGSVA